MDPRTGVLPDRPRQEVVPLRRDQVVLAEDLVEVPCDLPDATACEAAARRLGREVLVRDGQGYAIVRANLAGQRQRKVDVLMAKAAGLPRREPQAGPRSEPSAVARATAPIFPIEEDR